MFEKGKHETISTGSHAAETVVGSSVKLKGNLRSDGDIKIYGIVSGELKTKGSVVIGPEANIVASIKAKNVKISGTVQGNVEATEKIEITETGRVLGDIAAGILSIAPGAVFTGKSVMSEKGKNINFEPVMEMEPLDQVAEKVKEKAK